MLDRFKWPLFNLIMGKHPRNSICSFNYHNLRIIRRFLDSVCTELNNRTGPFEHLGTQPLIMADIGAGKSPYFSYFEPMLEKYIAVDYEGTLPLNETRAIEQIFGVAEQVPLEAQSVDLVLSNQVLEHVQDERAAVAEVYRILKPGGVMIGSVPSASPVHLEPYDFRRFTHYGLKQLLEREGFQVYEIQPGGGLWMSVALFVSMTMSMQPFDEGRPFNISLNRSLLSFPITLVLNLWAFLDDYCPRPFPRTYANLNWLAVKPLETDGNAEVSTDAEAQN